MRIALYEYCCCQPLTADPTADALRAEGSAMLTAIADDLACAPGVEIVCLVAQDFHIPFPFRAVFPGGEEAALREEAARADWVLVIAPETDGLLEERCQWVLEAGGRLLGPNLDAIRLTADKLLTASHLHRHGVPTPPTQSGCDLHRLALPIILKLRNGAGSVGMKLISTNDELKNVVDPSKWEMVAQPFLPGVAVSVASLLGPNQRIALPPAYQHLSNDNRFSYLGGSAPLPPKLAERAERIASAAIDVLPGLFGWIGVDVILGPQEDFVIEINPRLTTSYVGLRRLAQDNLAEAMLAVASGGDGVAIRWRQHGVQWTAAGSVRLTNELVSRA